MKYTCGPWYLNEEQKDVLFINNDNREICCIPLEENNKKANKEIRNTALLISKTPEMYELLKSISQNFIEIPEDEAINKLLKEIKEQW